MYGVQVMHTYVLSSGACQELSQSVTWGPLLYSFWGNDEVPYRRSWRAVLYTMPAHRAPRLLFGDSSSASRFVGLHHHLIP